MRDLALSVLVLADWAIQIAGGATAVCVIGGYFIGAW